MLQRECCAYLFSHVQLFVTPWAVALQALLSMGFLQARILEWVAMPSSRGSSQSRDWTQVSHIAGGFFTICSRGKPKNTGVGSLSLLQGASWPRKWTRVSCIAGRFFASWATREARYERSRGWATRWENDRGLNGQEGFSEEEIVLLNLEAREEWGLLVPSFFFFQYLFGCIQS